MNKTQKLLVALVAASTLSSSTFAADTTMALGVYGGVSLYNTTDREFKLPLDKDNIDVLSTFKPSEGVISSASWEGGVFASYQLTQYLYAGADIGVSNAVHSLDKQTTKAGPDDESAEISDAKATDAKATDAKATDEKKDQLQISYIEFMPAVEVGASTEITDGVNLSLGVVGGVAINASSGVALNSGKAADKSDKKATHDSKKEDAKSSGDKLDIECTTKYRPFVGPKLKLDLAVSDNIRVSFISKFSYFFTNLDYALTSAKDEKKGEGDVVDKTKSENKDMKFGSRVNATFALGVTSVF